MRIMLAGGVAQYFPLCGKQNSDEKSASKLQRFIRS